MLRRFVFEVPAVISVSLEAETEAEAWLKIKTQPELNKQFSARPFTGEKWFTCTPDCSQAQLIGYQVADDDSGMLAG